MSGDARLGRRTALVNVVALVLFVGSATAAYGAIRLKQAPPFEISLGAEASSTAPDTSGLSFRRFTNPDRTEVFGPDAVRIAILTDGARTVHLSGPPRTFAEPRFTNARITGDIYVRLGPREWRVGAETEPWFGPWFASVRAEQSTDILATAMEYVYGAAPKTNESGLQYSGDAAFGPLSDIDPDGRAENSDFYDYLGIPWTFPGGKTEKPSPTHIRSLDCSGFVRMVYGYRMGYPVRETNTAGIGLPRQAFAIARSGPGVLLMPNTGTRVRDLDRLLPGDMLFFNAGPVQGANIEHMGMYLGVDDRGHHRFISSRSQANGPTMGDLAGESILDGTGYWAIRLRTARRV